jgi:chorismate synthase
MIKDGKVQTKTNNNGGINGGITNGMPVVFQCAVKPTPSVALMQETVNFIENKELTHEIKGRHDPAIIRRIAPVIDSVTALVVCDMLASRYGTDVFTKGL